ncbi:acyl-coenzyme A thioesterase 1-like [Diadema antillarum]|uniref:acyl-coenzyme A thioesterase 1-like n=1 Tax=Diadema antillarum TaxID=105358 RepID=UPI003A84AAF0
MVPDAKSAKKKARLFKTDPDIHHWVYTFDLCDGNVPNADQGPGEILVSETVTRRFIAPDVEVYNVECESFQGTLYLPKETVAPSQLPLIVEMAALARRNIHDRPQLLASHGFAVLDFKYFTAIGEALLTRAPKGQNAYLDCQLFYDIVEFSRNNPRIDDTRSEDRYLGVKQGEDGSLWTETDFNHHVFDAANHEDYVAPATERMRQAGNGHLVDFVHLPGAGHLLYTPYLPLCTESRVYMPDVVDAPVYARWGGEPKLHAEAQVKAWQKMLDFFRKHLGPVESLRRDWLSSDSV